MSISSVLSPSTWLSQAASKNPLVAAAGFAAGSFASTLMQALQQAGSASAPAATSAARGLHHGHHAAQLKSRSLLPL